MNMETIDPYLQPVFGYTNKLARVIWWLGYTTLFRFSPKPMFGWRRFVLRLFGAKLGAGVRVYPRARFWAPWNLQCDALVIIANDAEIYNPAKVFLGTHVIISQDAYLCGATHDYNDAQFTYLAKPIAIEPYAWICARAVVMPGVTVHEGAVLGLGSVATRNLEAWSVYAGMPAKFINNRAKDIAS